MEDSMYIYHYVEILQTSAVLVGTIPCYTGNISTGENTVESCPKVLVSILKGCEDKMGNTIEEKSIESIELQEERENVL